MPELDTETNDFPKDENGSIDNSYGDLYIKCQSNIKITHGTGTEMGVYIPSKQKGVNILREIWNDKIGTKFPSENNQTRKYSENLCKELVSNEILIEAEILDSEVFFMFHAKDIEYYAKLLKARTSGANISPFSKKNLPKAKYDIPKTDIDKYKSVIDRLPKRSMNGKDIVDGFFIKKCNKEFMDNNKLKNDSRLKDKEYIHFMKLWDEYIEFLKTKEIA